MKKENLFISAMLAGAMISIGGTIFLALAEKNPIVGAIMFSVGLLMVSLYGMALYTGRIGYLIGAKPSYCGELAIIWIGNLAGSVAAGLLVRFSCPALVERAYQVGASNLEQNPLQTVILGIFCGILIYVAVDNFRKSTDCGRYLGILLCVPTFILAGFEHCVANMFYFTVGGTAEQLGGIVIFLLLNTLGNSLGAFLIPAARLLNVSEKAGK